MDEPPTVVGITAAPLVPRSHGLAKDAGVEPILDPMPFDLPPTSSLRAFALAARWLSFERAADELGLSPSALSRQIQGLEEHVGVALLDRRLCRPLPQRARSDETCHLVCRPEGLAPYDARRASAVAE